MEHIRKLTSSKALHDPCFPSCENLDQDQLSIIHNFNNRIITGDIGLESVPCLCGSLELDLLASVDRYRIIQPTVICRKCGLLQSQPRFTEQSCTEFYHSDVYYKLYSPDALTITPEKYSGCVDEGRRVFDAVVRYLKDKQPERVFEVGCAGGWNLVPFKEVGASVLGCDLASSIVEFGRQFDMDLRSCSAHSIQENDFDVVILSHVVEHFLNPVAEVAKIVERMSADGIIYIEVPDADNFCIGSLQNAHTYLFSRHTLKKFMAECYLDEVDYGKNGSHFYAIFKKTKQKPCIDTSAEYKRILHIITKYDFRQTVKYYLEKFYLLDFVLILKKRLF